MALVIRHITNELCLPFRAQGALTKYMAVVQGTIPGDVAAPGGADPATGYLGVTGTSAADGNDVDIIGDGNIVPMTAAAAIAKGAQVSIASALGDVHTAAPAGGVSVTVIGETLAAASGAGVIVPVFLNRTTIKG